MFHIVPYLSQLQDLGVGTSLARQMANRKSKVTELLSACWNLRSSREALSNGQRLAPQKQPLASRPSGTTELLGSTRLNVRSSVEQSIKLDKTPTCLLCLRMRTTQWARTQAVRKMLRQTLGILLQTSMKGRASKWWVGYSAHSVSLD